MAVYFIQHDPDGLIKIGSTSNFKVRFAIIRCHSPVPLVARAVIECDYWLEWDLQARFHQHLSHGEWFHPADEILGVIADHNAGGTRYLEFRHTEAILGWLRKSQDNLGEIAKHSGVSRSALMPYISQNSGIRAQRLLALIAAREALA
jgi:hypothetical protein